MYSYSNKVSIGRNDEEEQLYSVSATEKEYLILKFKDGRTEHIPGNLFYLLLTAHQLTNQLTLTSLPTNFN